MSKPAARKPTLTVSGYETSIVRCAVAVLLVLAGIAWLFVYTHWAMDAANYTKIPGRSSTRRSRGCRTCTSGTT